MNFPLGAFNKYVCGPNFTQFGPLSLPVDKRGHSISLLFVHVDKTWTKALKNPLAGPIRFELQPQVRKIQGPPRSVYK